MVCWIPQDFRIKILEIDNQNSKGLQLNFPFIEYWISNHQARWIDTRWQNGHFCSSRFLSHVTYAYIIKYQVQGFIIRQNLYFRCSHFDGGDLTEFLENALLRWLKKAHARFSRFSHSTFSNLGSPNQYQLWAKLCDHYWYPKCLWSTPYGYLRLQRVK